MGGNGRSRAAHHRGRAAGCCLARHAVTAA
jgi:hypothetical protein